MEPAAIPKPVETGFPYVTLICSGSFADALNGQPQCGQESAFRDMLVPQSGHSRRARLLESTPGCGCDLASSADAPNSARGSVAGFMSRGQSAEFRSAASAGTDSMVLVFPRAAKSGGFGTDTGPPQPGQGSVFEYAFSVTFKTLLQWGQVILKGISSPLNRHWRHIFPT